jgi:hypothetical protein
MAIRDDILRALPEVRATCGSDVFSPRDVINVLQRHGTPHSEGRIRTSLVNEMSIDVECVGHLQYRARV